ncbi:MAG: hypothetical protein ACP5LG_06520 [Conexivisphaera sp.]
MPKVKICVNVDEAMMAEFRRALVVRYGRDIKGGALSSAVEEAMRMWMERVCGGRCL